MKKLFAVLVVAVLFYGCASSTIKTGVSKEGEIEMKWSGQNITKNYVFARGMGAADQKLENKTQRQATSRRAAETDAYYQLTATVKGLEIEGGMTVEKAILTDGLLSTNVNASIKGATMVQEDYTSDDGCVVVLRLSKQAMKDQGIRLVGDKK